MPYDPPPTSIPKYNGHLSQSGAFSSDADAFRSAEHPMERPLLSVVDDDESVSESLPDLLREYGFAAQAFSSAQEFLSSDYLEKTRCLLLDVAMPGMSGLDLQQELKRRAIEVPIIFMTGQKDEDIRQQAFEEGAVEFLFKPFSDTALLDAVNAALPGK